MRRVMIPFAAVVLAAVTLGAQTKYKAPRTSWGDPDLSGNYTNKYEQGTPMERPAGFEGKSVYDVTPAELAEAVQKRKEASDARAPFLAGDPTGRIQGNAAFRDLSDMVRGHRAWMIVDPPDGRIPDVLPAAQARIRALPRGGSSFSNGPFDGPESLSLYDRCITRGYPNSMLPAIYGDSYQIVQGQGWVGIRYEMIHETRVIPLDNRPHASRNIRFDMGDARGHWDGDTLVVDTTNFNRRSVYRNADPDSLHVVERFTRTGPDTLVWRVTIDDAKTWARPWSFELPLTVNDAEPVFEYACHEGNYAMHNMLSASREMDREAAQAVKP